MGGGVRVRVNTHTHADGQSLTREQKTDLLARGALPAPELPMGEAEAGLQLRPQSLLPYPASLTPFS